MSTCQSSRERGGTKEEVGGASVGGACGDYHKQGGAFGGCQEVGGACGDRQQVGGASGDRPQVEGAYGDRQQVGGACGDYKQARRDSDWERSQEHQVESVSRGDTPASGYLSDSPVTEKTSLLNRNQQRTHNTEEKSGEQNFGYYTTDLEPQPSTSTGGVGGDWDVVAQSPGASPSSINCPPFLCPTTSNNDNNNSRRRVPFAMDLSAWLGDISVPVYFLVMFFAVASWVDINGLWVEVPLLVNELPEGWNLPSYLIIIIQIANIGPLIYTVANRLAPSRVKEWPVIYIIITIGAVSCLLLGFFWDVTTIIGGEEHSTALGVLTMFLAFVDCTSSVVFLPYMSIFKPQYMTAYYIGEGLSGLIPGLVGLAQGVGADPICVNTSYIVHNSTTGENHTEWEIWPEYKDPNFSVEVFFFFLCALICVSGVCFTVLNFAPFCQAETLSSSFSYEIKQDEYVPAETDQVQSGGTEPYNKLELQTSTDNPQVETSNLHLTEEQASTSTRDEDGRDRSKPRLSRGQLVWLLLITAWLNCLTNGVLPSTQSYTALPYGNLAYTLSVRLGTLANPLACFLHLLLPSSSLLTVFVLSGFGTLCSAYQLVLAAMSPAPPLQGEVLGDILCIGTFVVLVGLFSYCKVTIASMLQAEGGRKALLWCGVVTQCGSFVGAVITFVLVNVFKVFQSADPCTL